jgi:5-(carboxyamino)imidazole ribonucleotide synthase
MKATVGMLGGGQLGRMIALAGHPLGIRCVCLDRSGSAPAGSVAELVVGSYDDPRALERLASCDVVTYEWESVPEQAALALARTTPVRPSPSALSVAQDRLSEKTCFAELGIPTPRFAAASSEAELARALSEIGSPAVVKTRRLGYDGKGQRIARSASAADADRIFRELGKVPLIVESFVEFERELSILSVRANSGETAFYPLVQNHHEQGMLRASFAPAPRLTPELQSLAESHAERLLAHFDYVGVLALELFEANGELLANELAPRVHNSGHFTIEGAVTSQFENHLRAILGLPLGATTLHGPSAMLNLIGSIPDREKLERLLRIPDMHLHDYAKEPRPERKVGHVTICAPDAATLEERVNAVRAALV